MKERIKEYFIKKWDNTVKRLYADRFKLDVIEVVKVKKGKIREWRAYKNGVRISKEQLRHYQFNTNDLNK